MASDLGKPGYATWKRHRISAVVADDRGQFTTRSMTVTGAELSVNTLTRGTGGSVRIEVLDSTGKVIPRFGVDDASFITGDHLDARASWYNGASLSELQGMVVKLRFTLHFAKMFSIEFVS